MLYSNYTNRIKAVVAQSKQRHSLFENQSEVGNLIGNNSYNTNQLLSEQKKFNDKVQLNTNSLGNMLQMDVLPGATLGTHPDFKHLKNSNSVDYHYIVSVFIDIQGSTNLHNKYSLEEIFIITNTIQSAAIQTCLVLGGHIQRLQGDGVFAYFGGKNVSKPKATEMAVTACSLFTYFVKNDLKSIFLEDGIEDICTRIGIDFGDNHEVLWANFGIMDVSELTTLSLHTSLANKMQAYAKSNGIVVGQNVRDRLSIDEQCYDLVRDSKGEVIKRYIFQSPRKNFYYTQYTFDWFRFLKSLPFVRSDANGGLYISQTDFESERLKKLRETSALLSASQAHLDRQGNINSSGIGVKHEPHRFHYGK